MHLKQFSLKRIHHQQAVTRNPSYKWILLFLPWPHPRTELQSFLEAPSIIIHLKIFYFQRFESSSTSKWGSEYFLERESELFLCKYGVSNWPICFDNTQFSRSDPELWRVRRGAETKDRIVSLKMIQQTLNGDGWPKLFQISSIFNDKDVKIDLQTPPREMDEYVRLDQYKIRKLLIN